MQSYLTPLCSILTASTLLICTPSQAAEEEAKPKHVPLYERADDETLAKERARLKQERTDLKKQDKELKAEERKLKKQVRAKKKEIRSAEGQQAKELEAEKKETTEALEKVEQERDKIDDELSRNHTFRKEAKNFMFTPYAAPSYTPEMQLLFVAGVLMSFKTDRLDPEIQRSSIVINGGYSSTQAGLLYQNFRSFWKRDLIRFEEEFWFKSMPDNYWGVGYDAGKAKTDPDSTTAYYRTWWDFEALLTFKLGIKYLYGGLKINFNQTIATEVNDTMAQDPDFVEYGSNNYNGAIGAIVRYDSRDVAVNAFEGFYLSGEAMFYGPYLGGNNTYQMFDVDYRHYVPIVRKGSTLAWRINSRFGFGDVPWAEVSQIGNPFDLRGYQWGRYRDKTSLLGLLEYRIQFKRIRPKPGKSVLSRHGVVGWVGTGSVGDTFADLTGWLPNWGAGYRLELQPRMNLRLDFGFGNDTYALYFNFYESF